MRALSINISAGSAVSGFLNPGNYVDVIVTLKATQGEPAQTFTMMQAMTILAVNTRLGDVQSTEGSRGSQAKPSVTLAVTPEQAETLTHAHDQATLTLTLRNDIDVTNVLTNGAVVGELLGGEDSAKRLTIGEWHSAGGTDKRDGSLIIIKGASQNTENVLPQ
jgi:pilus assembly protein CpaB